MGQLRSDDPGPGRQVRFCTATGGARVAYAEVGRGPPLVVPAAWIGHLELSWEDPAVRAFYAPLAARRTVVQYDEPGCGLSGPWPGRQSLDADLEVLGAVVDHLGLDRFDLLGISMGAPVAIALAARQPQRVGRLVLYGGYADGHQLATDEVRAAMVDLVRAHWGLGSDVLADVFLPDGSAEVRAQFTRLQRGSTSAEVAADLLAHCYELRVADLLDRVATPTLVLHRRDDRAIPYRLGRDLAARIPGARLVTLSGRSHFPHVGDAAAVVDAVLEFLGEPRPRPSPPPPGPRPGPLTDRQLEVAALVAEGRTNRQIAERLGIEERSAEGHVERIRLRLGVTSRAQIAAWWARGARDAKPPE
jgi:pimeloyl-ACP methyl ester carboxylesterase/DNA-binding CsgD family transcriptional regulator